jgi:hypothetical protein
VGTKKSVLDDLQLALQRFYVVGHRVLGSMNLKTSKSFLVLFFKKELFAFSCFPRLDWRARKDG